MSNSDYSMLKKSTFGFPPREMPGPPMSSNYPVNTEIENIVFRVMHVFLFPVRVLSNFVSKLRNSD